MSAEQERQQTIFNNYCTHRLHERKGNMDCTDGSAMYVSSMKHMTYPLALPKEYCAELRDAASKTGLSMADIIRQSSKLGLPLLLEQLGPARLTNVPPWPAKIARALYSKPDDNPEGIERFMAAQSKNVQE